MNKMFITVFLALNTIGSFGLLANTLQPAFEPNVIY